MYFFKALQMTIVVLLLLSISKSILPGFYDTIFGNAILRLMSFALVVFFTEKQLGISKNQFLQIKIKIEYFFLALLLTVPAFLLGWAVTEIEVLIKDGTKAYFLNSDEIFAFSYPMKFFLTSLIISPILEEIFFRGQLMDYLRKFYGENLALIYSSLLFSFAHIRADNTFLSSIIYSFLLALVCGCMVLLTKNLKIAIFCHFIWNLLAYLYPTFMYQFNFDFSNLNSFGILIGILFLIAILMLFISYKFYKKLFFKVKNDTTL